jgi:hypothetical protein
MRDHKRVLDKKGVRALLQEVAQRHPDKYREVSHKLSQIGWRAGQETGGFSFGLSHLRKSKAGLRIKNKLQTVIQDVLAREDISDERRDNMIIEAVTKEMGPQKEEIFREALEAGNPLAMQVLSGSRGSPTNLASLLGSDLLYTDHHDRLIPIPVLHSYSEGLTPAEYWAGTYGARKGVMATKFATQEAGFLSKQLNQMAHRLVVTDEDGDGEPDSVRGLPVDVDDPDSEGALLAAPSGEYARNTVITPKILNSLRRKGVKRILVRSPIVGGSPMGGIYARDAGVREKGSLPSRGENIGLAAAQALSEPLSQAQLSAKHSGGVAGEEKAVSGFDYINQLIQVPKTFKGGAAHAQEDGIVSRIEDAPAGGKYIYVGSTKHYVGAGYDPKVEKGQKVEAGDVLSDGIPNPQEVVHHKGNGEGSRYFVQSFRQAMEEAGLSANRRNVELLSRGLINHVRLTEEYGDNVPDDVIPYSTLEHKWKPREGYQTMPAHQAVGRYLERPVLHYTIGTKVRPSMVKDLDEFGVGNVDVHENPPPFQPEMVRGMYSLQHDEDWQTRLYASGQKKSLLSAAHRGGKSDEESTSFVPSLARGVEFGNQGPMAQLPKIGKDEGVEMAEKQAKGLFGTNMGWQGGNFFDGGPPKSPAPSLSQGIFQTMRGPRQSAGQFAMPGSKMPMRPAGGAGAQMPNTPIPGGTAGAGAKAPASGAGAGMAGGNQALEWQAWKAPGWAWGGAKRLFGSTPQAQQGLRGAKTFRRLSKVPGVGKYLGNLSRAGGMAGKAGRILGPVGLAVAPAEFAIRSVGEVPTMFQSDEQGRNRFWQGVKNRQLQSGNWEGPWGYAKEVFNTPFSPSTTVAFQKSLVETPWAQHQKDMMNYDMLKRTIDVNKSMRDTPAGPDAAARFQKQWVNETPWYSKINPFADNTRGRWKYTEPSTGKSYSRSELPPEVAKAIDDQEAAQLAEARAGWAGETPGQAAAAAPQQAASQQAASQQAAASPKVKSLLSNQFYANMVDRVSQQYGPEVGMLMLLGTVNPEAGKKLFSSVPGLAR